jgi:hypothetical protein
MNKADTISVLMGKDRTALIDEAAEKQNTNRNQFIRNAVDYQFLLLQPKKEAVAESELPVEPVSEPKYEFVIGKEYAA